MKQPFYTIRVKDSNRLLKNEGKDNDDRIFKAGSKSYQRYE